ncbi:uncharacterized protein BT62DRAFT_135530 [Guyanagaster necrorhizus]|uniref:Uncharacterized protein n=1 Tax=Guyanagaster necrorhizus TaxID=856835 RepID=A0A9P7VDV2_9AGAR|nr:uncharacterized protein BT62DRAFT_135530 [Guyanagaster necrorhizus MCA 3950]KAG7439078.1 hypothetical protein BT62DRAFT_135530 [Guyanagaster necrorhizus MCA 3950]
MHSTGVRTRTEPNQLGHLTRLLSVEQERERNDLQRTGTLISRCVTYIPLPRVIVLCMFAGGISTALSKNAFI